MGSYISSPTSPDFWGMQHRHRKHKKKLPRMSPMSPLSPMSSPMLLAPQVRSPRRSYTRGMSVDPYDISASSSIHNYRGYRPHGRMSHRVIRKIRTPSPYTDLYNIPYTPPIITLRKPRRSFRKLPRSFFGQECLGFANAPPQFMFGTTCGTTKKTSFGRKANPMAAKAMKYYQAHKHEGVSLRDAWASVRGRSHKVRKAHKAHKFLFGFGDDDDDGDNKYGGDDNEEHAHEFGDLSAEFGCGTESRPQLTTM